MQTGQHSLLLDLAQRRIWSHKQGLILLGIFTAQIKTQNKSPDKSRQRAKQPAVLEMRLAMGGLGSGTSLLSLTAVLGRTD